jgi:SNF family Na+-dependent transporter
MIKLTYVISIIAFLIVIYNITIVDWQDPFSGDGIITLIAILCGLCCILIMTILRKSKKIQQLENKN